MADAMVLDDQTELLVTRRPSIVVVPDRRRRVSEACRELEPPTPFKYDVTGIDSPGRLAQGPGLAVDVKSTALPAKASDFESTASMPVSNLVHNELNPSSGTDAAPSEVIETQSNSDQLGTAADTVGVLPCASIDPRPCQSDDASNLIIANSILVCLDKPVGQLLHGFETRRRPYSRRSLLPIPADALGGPTVSALAMLHRNPHPAIIQFRGAIEPTADRGGFMICDPLFGDLGTVLSPLSDNAAFALFCSMLTAVGHCHATGVAVGAICLRSFCWADTSRTRVVLAGLSEARTVRSCSTSEQAIAFADDIKRLGETFVLVVTHHMNSGARQPSVISDRLCKILAAMLAPVPAARPSAKELLNSPEFCAASSHISGRAVDVALGSSVATSLNDASENTQGDQVVPGNETAAPAAGTSIFSRRKRKLSENNSPMSKRLVGIALD